MSGCVWDMVVREHGFQILCFHAQLRAPLIGMDKLEHIKCSMFLVLVCCGFGILRIKTVGVSDLVGLGSKASSNLCGELVHRLYSRHFSKHKW